MGGGGFSGGMSRGDLGGGGFDRGDFGGGGLGSSPIGRSADSFRPEGGFSPSSVHGPYGGTVAADAGPGGLARPGATGAGERQVYDTPRGGTLVAGGERGTFGGSGGYVYDGPHGAVSIGGARGGSFTGPGGNTIAGGQAGHVTIGPNGNVHAGGTEGVGVKGPDGAAVAGGHGAATIGQDGVAARGTRAAAATGPGGTIAGASHGAVAAGPYGAAAAGGRVVAGSGAYGGGFAGTRYCGAADLRGQGAYVRNNFGYYNAFRPNWYTRYPGAWYSAGWAAGSFWNNCSWMDCAGYMGYPATTTPLYFNYGDNVTYQDGNVYYGDQVAATQQAYAQQAAQIATAGQQAQPAADEKWQALGVFAMIQGDETTSNDIFQLALNKDGVLRGNYYNAVSDSATPVVGSLDKKSQRVAWNLEGKKAPVYETGLYNLTQDQTTLLVHFDRERTEQYKLFRVPPQQEQKPPESGPIAPRLP